MTTPRGDREKHSKETGHRQAESVEDQKPSAIWQSALLLGSAMVARGEIGLLIIEIGYNNTSYVSEDGFITGVWAILLNTIIGPVTVGILVKVYGHIIGEGEWGVQKSSGPEVAQEASEAAV